MKNLSKQASVYRRPHFKPIPIGTIFGFLIVLENDLVLTHRSRLIDACRLRCKCGKEIVRCYASLKHKTIHKSCGCERHKLRKDKHALISVGTKFGRWTVIETGLYRKQGKTTARACRVLCECGTEFVQMCAKLKAGTSQSCGCSYRKFPQGDENVWYKLHSKLNRGNFHLTVSEMKALVEMPCLYCGHEPANICRHPHRDQTVFYSGIDRIDPSKDYVRGNVVPCCWPCNRMKSAQPLADFLGRIERIYARNHSVSKVHQQAAVMCKVSSYKITI